MDRVPGLVRAHAQDRVAEVAVAADDVGVRVVQVAPTARRGAAAAASASRPLRSNRTRPPTASAPGAGTGARWKRSTRSRSATPAAARNDDLPDLEKPRVQKESVGACRHRGVLRDQQAEPGTPDVEHQTPQEGAAQPVPLPGLRTAVGRVQRAEFLEPVADLAPGQRVDPLRLPGRGAPLPVRRGRPVISGPKRMLSHEANPPPPCCSCRGTAPDGNPRNIARGHSGERTRSPFGVSSPASSPATPERWSAPVMTVRRTRRRNRACRCHGSGRFQDRTRGRGARRGSTYPTSGPTCVSIPSASNS